MRRLGMIGVALVLLLAGLANAQDCPPGCTCVCGSDLLGYECSGGANANPALVLSDGFVIQLTGTSQPANFDVDGDAFILTIGGTTLSGVIKDGANSARFITNTGGQCIGLNTVKWATFPGGFTVNGRGLSTSKSNPFLCQDQNGTRNILCIQVKGQVGAPFPNLPNCTPDRVEYACGVAQLL